MVWRGPVIAGTVKQFYTDVIWRDVDFMFVDMPPGTGDVPLTVFQSLPIAGIVVVTSPQDLVSMIVEKAVNMARMMNIPVLGIVENMSYYECPHCGERSEIFGRSHIDETAHRFNIPAAARLPINPKSNTRITGRECGIGSHSSFLINRRNRIEEELSPQPALVFILLPFAHTIKQRQRICAGHSVNCFAHSEIRSLKGQKANG